jgi:hypothetical protein
MMFVVYLFKNEINDKTELTNEIGQFLIKPSFLDDLLVNSVLFFWCVWPLTREPLQMLNRFWLEITAIR